MKKYFLFPLFSLIFLLGLSSGDAPCQIPPPNVNSTEMSVESKEQDELVLDKNEICIPCELGFRPNEDSVCDINMMVAVSAAESDDKKFTYKYTVSGGRIIGEGASVAWDMTGAQPGTYQISVEILNESNNVTEEQGETITVYSQSCGGIYDCPIVSVDAPALPVKAGEIITFKAVISGGSGAAVTSYGWTVSNGKIIEGQGTSVIKVAANSKMAGKTVEATVEVGGVAEECDRTESASATIIKSRRGKNKK